MNKYFHVLNRLANVPLLIGADKLAILTSNVVLPILRNEQLTDNGFTATEKAPIQANNKTYIINVFDSLVSKSGAGASGFTSYSGIKSEILNAVDRGYTTIGFYVDSPGGEASGLFALTDFIHSLPIVYGISTFGFTDGSATSAAYAVLSSCQTIYATEGSTLGSIGAVISLIDVTEADKKEGIKYTILRSKEEKALYNPHEETSDKVIEKALENLQVIDNLFNVAVNKYRPNLTIETIQSLKADSFFAVKAKELGLVDEIVSSLDSVMNLKKESSKPSLNNRGNTMATLEELNTQISALVTENNTLKDSVAGSITKAVEQERTRCVDILKAGLELKVSSDTMLKRISNGSSKEDSLDVFTAIAEAQASFNSINTSNEPSSTVQLANAVNDTKLTIGNEETTVSAILSAVRGVK